MQKSAILLLSFASFLAAQTSRPLSVDQFPNADPAAVSPLVNVTPQIPIVSQAGDALPVQKIGPGDLISISVSDCPDLTRNFRVSSAGLLTLPLLKEPIVAAGKEPPDIEVEVTNALIKDEVLVRPVVTASVVEYRSVPVSVMGAVKHPITFQAVGVVTLLDALARAEGLSEDHGAEILLTRPRAPGAAVPGAAVPGAAAPLVQRIPVDELIHEADPALNVRLFGGEEIRVPAAGKVFVVGNVKKPGVYPIQDGNETSIFKMVAMSEGLLQYTNKQAFIYRREGGKDQRNEIPVEIGRIMDRKSPDVMLHANDILYIPDNKGRRLTSQTIERIIGFGTATGTGLLVWH
jgi:polysaccharide biosynthesis/export protein